MPHPDSVARSRGASTGFARILARQPTAKGRTEDRDNPHSNSPLFRIEKRCCWGPISVHIVDRAAGEVIFRNDCYRLTYYLTDFHATMEDDERPQWECQLLSGNFVFRPPDTTLRSNLTAGRFIHILQRRDTYTNLTSEMVRGGVANLTPRYNLRDPLILQLVSTIAHEVAGGLFDTILVDALNTALAVQITRLCGERSCPHRRTACRESG